MNFSFSKVGSQTVGDMSGILYVSTLAEIIGSQESTGKRKPQKAKIDIGAAGDQDQSQQTLRNFVQKTNENEDTSTGETSNIVMNEDGVMYAG